MEKRQKSGKSQNEDKVEKQIIKALKQREQENKENRGKLE